MVDRSVTRRRSVEPGVHAEFDGFDERVGRVKHIHCQTSEDDLDARETEEEIVDGLVFAHDAGRQENADGR
jgi:hypothetical protein